MTILAAKDRAKKLREILHTLGYEVSHSHSLEVIARMTGARDWNEYVTQESGKSQTPVEQWFARQAIDKSHTWRLKMTEGLLKASIRFGASVRAEAVFEEMLSDAELTALGLRIADETGHSLYVYNGSEVWRLEPAGQHKQVPSYHGKRSCMAILQQNDRGEWVPSYVIEDEPGHYLTDWAWGTNREQAEQIAEKYNLERGVLKDECMEILATSLALSV